MQSADSEILKLPGGPARIEWRRSQRARRVSLRIDPRGGAVVVTLPPRTGRTAGMALLMNNADWVAARLAALPGHVPFAVDAVLPLHGIAHRIDHVGPTAEAAGGGSVWVENQEIRVAGEIEFLPRRVADFLRGEARRRMSALVAEKAAAGELRPSRVTVKDTHSRWGSCASSRALAFSWRLVMAPPFVQDYVAAHEVAHLRHMNHGPRFWALVQALTPYTKDGVAWLRTEGPRLLRIG